MALTPQPVPTTYTEGNCSGYTTCSEVFRFIIEPNCSRSDNVHYQLMWLNRYGHYDYYTFIAARYEGYNIERQTYNSWSTDWGSASPSKVQYARGLTDSQVAMQQNVIVNTGFINQPDFMFLEELYTSNEVYEVQPDGGLYPINITNTEFVKKIKGNRTIYNLELTYVYSNNITLLGK